MTERDVHVLVAYDGSPEADRAVEQAAHLFPGARATVVTCWTSAHEAARDAHTVMPSGMIAVGVERMDEATRDRAYAAASEGARRATAAGLRASASEQSARGAVWGALVALADELAVDAIVVGPRRQSELRPFVLGSTSHGVLHHARVPVLLAGAPT
jgi:nucleotide-binding universal stress UspA family protein